MCKRADPAGDYLAICAIFRDEADYLEEWIAFHQLVGVEHFFLYDNGSQDHSLKVLQRYIDDGTVTLTYWPIPFHEQAQRKAYLHCLEATRNRVRWLAFIDIDEFLFAPENNNSLPQVLHDYEAWPGVVVHWQNYGSSGERSQSPEPVIERFSHRSHRTWIRNRKIKSIVDPVRTIGPAGVHHFTFLDEQLAVDETKTRVKVRANRLARYKKRLKPLYAKLGPLLRFFDPYSSADLDIKSVPVNKLRINHYPVKSYEEFLRKTNYKKEKRRYDDIDYFAYHDRNEVYDNSLHKYLPALREQLLNDRQV